VTRPLEKEENRSSQCAITGSLSRRKKNIAPLTRGGRLDGEVSATLFMSSGEKLKCGWLAATPATRLGGEHRGASTLPFHSLVGAMVQHSGLSPVREAQRQWRS
jgi:hypothetical protein